jgi:hypothetical protein
MQCGLRQGRRCLSTTARDPFVSRGRGGDATKRRVGEVESKTEDDDVTMLMWRNENAKKYLSGSLLYSRYR